MHTHARFGIGMIEMRIQSLHACTSGSGRTVQEEDGTGQCRTVHDITVQCTLKSANQILFPQIYRR